MNKRTRLFGCAAAVSLLALAAPANAYTIGAYAGSPFSPGQGACFSKIGGGGVQNTGNSSCTGGGAQWDVYVPVNAGTLTPSVSVLGGFGTIQCAPFVWSPTTEEATTPGWTALTATGTFNLDQVTIPTNGFLFIACNIPSGSALYAVNY